MDRPRIFAALVLSQLALSAPAGAETGLEPKLDAEIQDARAQTDAALVTMEALSLRMRTMLQRVRRERAPALACVDASLTRVDVAWRRGREHARLQTEAWQKGRAEEARLELRHVLSHRDYARKAAAEGDACFPRK